MSIRKAASLIVCSYNSLAGLQVLLLQRSSFGFYGGLAVFPGGKVDDADGSTDWRNLGLSSDLDRQQPQKLAALRETFEEAGLLLTSAPVASAQALDWRKRVLEAGRAQKDTKLQLIVTGTGRNRYVSIWDTAWTIVARASWQTTLLLALSKYGIWQEKLMTNEVVLAWKVSKLEARFDSGAR